MSELRPQFTYSAEGKLVVTTGLNESMQFDFDTPGSLARMAAHRREQIEIMSQESGVEVDQADDIFTIAVDVAQRFEPSFKAGDDADVEMFITRLSTILSDYPSDSVDRVLSLDYLSATGANGVVNQHFQRWLNSGEFSDDIAFEAALALALPFGDDIVSQVKKHFQYSHYSNGQVADAYSSRVAVADEKFGLSKIEKNAETHITTDGEVTWSNLTLSTLGSCACWGASGQERERVRLGEPTMGLYEMSPHNVDAARQSLSLILGAGVLAHHAAHYGIRVSPHENHFYCIIVSVK